MTIHQDLTSNQQLLARIKELEAKLATADKPKAITLKVSTEKKCLSVYGLQRTPVSLYAGQWLRLIAEFDRIKEFIEDNRDLLAWKE
jgi:hypothetical protein